VILLDSFPGVKRVPKKPARETLIFARNMRSRRKLLDLSQEELAAKSGMHWTFIARVERAETSVTLRSIVKIAKGLGCKAAELMSGI
jgi:transcriptional regulator with XRE-family HTH domain